MFFLSRKKRGTAISLSEEKRLRTLPRYRPAQSVIFGKKIFTNDACTLLGDLHEIIGKEIYRFQSESEMPIILDCGANIGISVIYFKKLYPKAKIVAFEPDPILFQILSKNISSFSLDNVTLHQAAIWINDYGVNFLTEGGHSGRISEYDDKEKIILSSSVQLKKILENFETVDLLKIDIEGAEDEVIFDSGENIKKCKNIFIEYHSESKKKQNLHDILRMFNSFGYRYHIHESFARKHPFVDRDCIVDMDLQLNLFFYKE